MKKNMDIAVSHEWIYQYILKDKLAGGSLYLLLRFKKKRKKRYGSNERRGILKNRIGIDLRPAIVDTRSRVGDWEADTIIGKANKQAYRLYNGKKVGTCPYLQSGSKNKGKHRRCDKTIVGLYI